MTSAPVSVPAGPGRAGFHRLVVGRVDPLCDDAVAVTFDVPPEAHAAFAFLPGQSLTLRRDIDGVEQRRSYSICSPSGAAPRIGVRRVPGGAFSEWLVDACRPGDVVEVGTPTGRFVCPPGTTGHHVLVAAGSGVTPLLSIAASLLAGSAEAEVTFVYANRRSDSAMFLDELADLKDRHHDRFSLVHVLSREPREVELFCGRLDGSRLARILALLVEPAEVAGWWLCGPHPMLEEHRGMLVSLGVEPARIHRELFFVDAPPPPVVHHDGAEVGDHEVLCTLDGRTTSVRVPAATSVLDAARRTRPDVPFACRGGVCGTCRARVVEGEAQMRRNFALEPEEVAAGFVLTCQAHPVTERVAVDFDA